MTALATNGRQSAVTTLSTGNESPLANLLDSSRFEQLQRLATLMAHSSLTPKHLRGNSAQEAVGNCFRVVNQAIRWGFDPFAVADESYVVSGKLGYQGKLVAAVINSRANLKENLRVDFKGSGDARTATVIGHFKSETQPRTIELSVGQAKTDNGMWKKDPDQKLFYSATIKWARRHCPEIVMGVLTDEELEAMRAGASTQTGEAKEVLSLPAGRSKIRKTAEKPVEEAAEAMPPVESTETLAEGEIVDDGAAAEEPTFTTEQEAMARDFADELAEFAGDKAAILGIGNRLGAAREKLGTLYESLKLKYMDALKACK